MMRRVCAGYFLLSVLLMQPVFGAPATIHFWHAMSGDLGKLVEKVCQQFNQMHSEYHVTPIYKGDYATTLTSTVAAFRAHQQPALVQVFDVGTATMMLPAGAIVPAYHFLEKGASKDFIPAARGYYGDAKGRLIGFPFFASSAVLYYNKKAFMHAGLDPEKPPRTWPAVRLAAERLLQAGQACGITSAWPAWTQLESFSAWHNIPFATEANGFHGLRARLRINHPVTVRHIARLARWQQTGIFRYGGPGDSAVALFTSEQCAMLLQSSGSQRELPRMVRFPVGMGPLPYWPDVKQAPQNTLMGGSAIWILQGRPIDEYQAVRAFLHFLQSTPIQRYWQTHTGYTPVTKAAHQASQQQGYYQRVPDALVAFNNLYHKPATPYSRGIRLGYLPQIRRINEEALEAVWSGRLSAQAALNRAVQQGDRLLKRFEHNVVRGEKP